MRCLDPREKLSQNHRKSEAFRRRLRHQRRANIAYPLRIAFKILNPGTLISKHSPAGCHPVTTGKPSSSKTRLATCDRGTGVRPHLHRALTQDQHRASIKSSSSNQVVRLLSPSLRLVLQRLPHLPFLTLEATRRLRERCGTSMRRSDMRGARGRPWNSRFALFSTMFRTCMRW